MFGMDTPARNFHRNYPLAGERIGPAWLALWSALHPRQWQTGRSLAEPLAPRLGVAEATLSNLLWRAEKSGHVQKRIVVDKARSRKVVQYRGIEHTC